MKTLVSLFILLFWGVMTGWLVKANWNGGNAPFSEIAPQLVFRQVLKHEVTSQLTIFHKLDRIGTITITPLHTPDDSISLDGNLFLPGENGKKQAFNFSTRIDLDGKTLAPNEIVLRLRRREPALAVLIEILLQQQLLRYEMKSGEIDLGRQEIPLTNASLLQFTPYLAGLPALPADAASALQNIQWQANRASHTIRGERLDGFRLSINLPGLEASAALGQLGEIYYVRTSANYHLLADGLEPEKYLQ